MQHYLALTVDLTRSRFCTTTGTAAHVRQDAPGWRLQPVTATTGNWAEVSYRSRD
jgi:hypothetical protein